MLSSKKILLKQNVWDAALERIRWIFQEFDNVIVSTSGGKDSTVVFNLCLIVAREMKRLPLRVMFLDQEAEWRGTEEVVEDFMGRSEVRPMWMQTPFRINNAVSYDSPWFIPWAPEAEADWIRPRSPLSRKERYPDLFIDDMFLAIQEREFPNETACYIAGVRTEESPRRMLGLTSQLTYKHVTWGKKLGKNKFTFYPIYDWTFRDVWKAIHDNGWKYNVIYDKFFQHGIRVPDMRISSLNHETSLRSLFILQELEPDRYERLSRRIPGISASCHFGKDDFYCAETLPPMFKDWKEYRDFLLEKLIVDAKHKDGFRRYFAEQDERLGWVYGDGLYKRQISSILANDFGFWKLRNITVPRDKYDEYKQRRKDARALQGRSTKRSASDEGDVP